MVEKYYICVKKGINILLVSVFFGKKIWKRRLLNHLYVE